MYIFCVAPIVLFLLGSMVIWTFLSHSAKKPVSKYETRRQRRGNNNRYDI